MKRLLYLSLILLMVRVSPPADATVTAFLSAGTDCSGSSSANFISGAGSVSVSFCITTTTETICNASFRLLAANAGENGRFNLTGRTLSPAFGFSNLGTLAVPFPINNPASTALNTTDYGAGTTNNLPVVSGANTLIATLTLAPQTSANNASYVLSLDPANAVVGIDQDMACGALGTPPIDVPVAASFTLSQAAAPAFSTGNSSIITVNSPATFTVVATGTPQPALSMTSGMLPSGITFTPGTGLLNGTPALGTVGSYPLVFNATNGVSPDATQNFTLTVQKANQAINFGTLVDRPYSATSFALSANSSVGSVTFASSTGNNCSVSGNNVTMIAIGTCTIVASQLGDANYNAAAPISQSFAITGPGPHLASPSAGANGSISPNTPVPVAQGGTTSFTVTPNTNYTATVGGTCGGSLAGNIYTTNAITAACTVVASFALTSYTVTPSAGPNGSISPSTPVPVLQGATTSFTVTPNTGFNANVAGTCGGSLVGNIFTTNSIAASCTVDATFVSALNLVSVVSRKTHGTPTAREISLDPNLAIGDAIPVEPRTIGAGHLVVFTFDNPINDFGSVSVTDAALAPVGMAALARTGNEVQVTLTGIPDNKRVKVSLTGVNGFASASVSVGFLVGDVTNSRSVNASDISAVKAHMNLATDGTNFRFDLNASGTIGQADVTAVKARSGLVLP